MNTPIPNSYEREKLKNEEVESTSSDWGLLELVFEFFSFIIFVDD